MECSDGRVTVVLGEIKNGSAGWKEEGSYNEGPRRASTGEQRTSCGFWLDRSRNG